MSKDPVKRGPVSLPLLAAALVAVVLGLGAVVGIWSQLEQHAYHPPFRIPSAEVAQTPHDQALKDQAVKEAAQDKAKPYKEVEYRQFPVVGSRVAIWVAAQLHLLFAAFVLAVPLFAIIIEIIG